MINSCNLKLCYAFPKSPSLNDAEKGKLTESQFASQPINREHFKVHKIIQDKALNQQSWVKYWSLFQRKAFLFYISITLKPSSWPSSQPNYPWVRLSLPFFSIPLLPLGHPQLVQAFSIKWEHFGGHWWASQLHLRSWQCLPTYGEGQWHLKSPSKSLQVPPFSQGWPAQSFTSAERSITSSFTTARKDDQPRPTLYEIRVRERWTTRHALKQAYSTLQKYSCALKKLHLSDYSNKFQ